MQIGQKRHRLNIQAPAMTQDTTTGELVPTWTTIGTVWASIEPMRGRERLLGDQIAGETDTRIKVRWNQITDQITVGHRGEHQGTIFNFVNVAHLYLEQREVEIMAKSGVNDG